MKHITLTVFKSLEPDKRQILSDAVIAEACRIMLEGYSSCIAVRYVNKTFRITHDTIYYICGKSEKYVQMVEEIKRERNQRHRKFLDMRSIAV